MCGGDQGVGFAYVPMQKSSSCNWIDKTIKLIVFCAVVVGVCVVGKKYYDDRYSKTEAIKELKRKKIIIIAFLFTVLDFV